MHPSFDWFCQHRRRWPLRHGTLSSSSHGYRKRLWVPNSSEFPHLRRRRLSLFYPPGGRRYFLHDDSSSKNVSRRFGIYDRQGTLLFSTTSPFGRPRERWYISSLTWTFQLPLLGRSIKTSSTIILINVSSTMMISSIVDGFGSYYSLSPFGGHARESLVCSSPLLLLTSATQSQSIGFMPIILRIVFDSTSSIRLL